MRRYSSLFAAFTAGLFCACSAITSEPETATQVSFRDDIKPIFESKCVMCHNRKTLPDTLNFENAKGAFVTDKNGLAYIVPGKPEESRLYTNIIAPEFYDLAMPPVSHRVTKAETETIRLWIAEGADWPSGAAGRIEVSEIVRE